MAQAQIQRGRLDDPLVLRVEAVLPHPVRQTARRGPLGDLNRYAIAEVVVQGQGTVVDLHGAPGLDALLRVDSDFDVV